MIFKNILAKSIGSHMSELKVQKGKDSEIFRTENERMQNIPLRK